MAERENELSKAPYSSDILESKAADAVERKEKDSSSEKTRTENHVQLHVSTVSDSDRGDRSDSSKSLKSEIEIGEALKELIKRVDALEGSQLNYCVTSSILASPPRQNRSSRKLSFDKVAVGNEDSKSTKKSPESVSKKADLYLRPSFTNSKSLTPTSGQKKSRRTKTPSSPLRPEVFRCFEVDSKFSSVASDCSGAVPIKRLSLLDYIRAEIFGADDHGLIDTQVNKTVKNFLSVPRQLERLLFFGLLICLDTFLYITTFLPLRIIWGTVLAFWCAIGRLWNSRFSSLLAFDCMRGLIIAQCIYALQSVQMSRVYHYIRGQSMIKLYVLIGMVEIFDKLMCSFGQDALDSLYWSTMRCKKRMTVLNFIIVCVQITLHSILLFVHVTTLTVAVNSSDQALLTLLISNNFAEIKSSVFKKFDKHNLFQLSCHDIVERFKLILFLILIMLLNISHGGDENLLSQFMNIFLLVFGGEILADWIKHAFITKFNLLQPNVYEEYSVILARDITSCRKEDDSLLDHTHLVSRRLAFATLPLNCVMIRFLQIAIPRLRSYIPDASPARLSIIVLLFYLITLAAKILTGMLLMAHSFSLQYELQLSAADALQRSPASDPKMRKKELSLEKLAGIARFTQWRGRIV